MAAELAIIAKLQDDASSGIRALRGEVEGLGDSGGIAAKGFQALQSVGTVAVTAIGVAVTAAAAAAAIFVKSAIEAGIEFESAFAGVVKTVDGVVDAGGQLTEFGEELRDSFRQLALEIPVAVTELAKIGELGGQLGVAGEDLLEFTRLIAQLGVTTNLSSEQAAMSFAQFGNIMNSSQEDLTRFGSAVVWLGNNFATTEADIVEFSTRIAGAGAIAGMTEADLAGVGAAFSSVGVQAEAGGTAVQKVLLDINTAVVTGGSQLEKYAAAAGMSAEQFAKAWQDNPAEAFTQFVEGLGRAGDQAILILDDLGMADARLTRAFLSVAGAGDLLRTAIEGSNDAFVENMALAREAALRFQTVESQMQLFRNVVNDVKIALYDALRPAIVAILSSLTMFITSVAPQVRQWFEAIGAAVGNFVTGLLSGEDPIGDFANLAWELALAFGATTEQANTIFSAVRGVGEAIVGVVGWVAQAVGGFVSWKDVLIAVGIAIGSVVIPVLLTIGQAVLPLIAVFVGMVAVVAAVRTAWEADFLGIRTAVEGVVETVVRFVDAFGDSFQDSGDLIGSLVVGFQNLVGPTTVAGQAILQIGERVREFANGVREFLQPAVDWIKQLFGGLGEDVGPAGEAFGTLAGVASEAGQAVSEIGEKVGGIQAAFQSLAGGTSEAGQAFSEFRDRLQGVIDFAQALFEPTIERIKQAILGLGDDFGPVAEKLGVLKEAFSGLVQALAPVVTTIAAVVGGLIGVLAKFLGEVLAGIINNAGTIIGGLVTFVTGVVDGVTNAVQSLVTIVSALLTEDWAGAWEGAKGYVAGWVDATRTQLEGLGQVVDGVLGTVVDAVVNTFNDLTGAALPSWEQFKQAAGDAFQAVVERIREALQPLADFFGPTFDRIREAFAGLGESFAPVGEKLGELGGAFKELEVALQPILGLFQQFASFVGQVLLGTLQGVATVIGAIVAVIAKFLGEVLAGIIANAGTIIGGLVTVVTGVVDGITGTVQALVDGVRALLQGDWQGVWEAAKGYLSGFVSSAQTILSGLLAVIDGIFGAIWDAVVNTINDISGSSIAGWEQFKTAVVEKFTQIRDSINAAVDGWNEAINSKIAEIATAITTTVEGWKTSFTQGLEAIKTAITTTVEGWKTSFTQGLEAIKTAITTTVEGWKTSFTQGLEAIKTGIPATLESWKTSFTNGLEAIKTAISTKVTEWITSFTTFADNVRSANIGQRIVDSIVEGLASFVANVGTTLSGWYQAFTNWVSNIDWYQVGYNIVDFIIEALIIFPQRVAATLVEWGQAFRDWAESTAADLWDAGVQLVDNIIEGLKEFPGKAEDAVRDWAEVFRDWATNTAADLWDAGVELVENIIEGLNEFESKAEATVSNWAQVFWDWATSTAADLWNAGVELVENIIEGLQEFPGKAEATVSNWAQVFWDWATSTAADLWDAGVELVENIIDGLNEFESKAEATVSNWAQVFWDWVTSTAADLWNAGVELVENIIEGLKEFPAKAQETLATWITTFAQWVGNSVALLVIIGSAIVTHVVTGLKEFWTKAVTTVSGWFASIKTYISTKTAELIGLGQSIVQGIIQGITNMAQGVINAVSQVIQGGIARINELLGWPHSPAPALIPIGSTISEGLAFGILQSGGLVTSAIGQVAANMKAAGVEEFGSAMSAIAQGIGAALSAALDVALFKGPGGGFSSGLRSISEMMAELVSVLVGANSHSAEVLEELSAFLEVVGEIGAVLNSVRDATGVVMNFQPPPLNIVTLAFERMAGYLAVMLTVLNGLTLETIGVVSELGDFIDVATELGTLMVSIHSAVGAAMNWQPPPLNIVATAVGVMAQHLAAVMTAFFEANRFGLGGLAILTEFAGTAAAIAEMVGPAVGAMHDLNAFGSVQLDTFHHGVAQLAYTLQIVMQAFNQANTFGSLVLGQISDFADTAGGIAEMVGPAILAMHELDAFGAVGLDTFHEGIAQLAYTLQIVLQNFVRVNTFGSAVLGLAREFAEAAGAVVDVIAPAIEGMDELNAFGSVRLDRFHEGVAQLAYTLQVLVGAFVRANNFGSAMLAQARDFAETAGEIIDVVGEAIEVMGLLSGYASSTQQIGVAVQAFAADLLVLLNTLVGAFAAAAAAAGGAVATAAEFAGHAEDIIDVVEPGIEALSAMAGYVQVSGVRALVQVFAADLLAVVRELGLAFSAASVQMGEAAGLGAEFAGHAEDIIGVVEPGIEAIAALAGYVAASGVREKTALFATDLMLVLQALGDVFALATAEIIAMAAEGAEFAGHVEDIVDVIEPGIDAIAALSGYVAASGIQTSVMMFAHDLMQVLVALGDVFALATAEMLSAAEAGAEFAGHVEDIVDVIEPGIDAILALAGYVAASGLHGQAAAFAADLIIVVQTILDGLTQSGLLTNDATVAAGELAEGIGDLVGMVTDGVEALAALATYAPVASVKDGVRVFAADLIVIVQTLVTAFQDAGLLANNAITEAGEMSGALSDIVGVIQPAVEAVVYLVGYVQVAGIRHAAEQFAADLALVVQALVDGLEAAGILANQAVAEAGEMAGHLQDLMKVVEPALDPDKGALPLINKYMTDGNLKAKTQQFTADLIAVTQILVDGLTASALASGIALAKAGEMAKNMKDLFEAIAPSMKVIEGLAEYTKTAGLEQKTQQFTNDLIATTTILVTGLTAAATELGSAAIEAARRYTQNMSNITGTLFTVMAQLTNLAGGEKPADIQPILKYLITSSEQITGAFAQAGDIGTAVQYAESFRLNLLQLVNEVKAAVAYLTALAGTGVSGSVGAALAAIAASLQNTEGQFAGAGAKLATALIDALRGGIDGGEGAVVQALAGVLAALEGAGMAEARDFDNVGAAIDDAMVDGVKAGQSQVMAAVVQVVAAAVAAGLSEAKKAAAIGEEMIRAVLAEVGSGRSQLDQAGVAAGAALIDGMVRAITLGKSRLVNAIKDAVNSAVAAAKAALGIASPSRVAFELIDNFMRTAAGRFGDASGLVTAVGRSIDATMTAAMKRLEQVRLDVPVVAMGRDITRTLVPPPVVHSRPSAGALAFDGAGRGGTVNVYGNIVLPNVSNPVSFLEELDALRGGG